MYRIWTKGREIKTILGSSRTGSPDYHHYIRLFILSGVDMVVTIPFNLWYTKTYVDYIFPWPGLGYIRSLRSQITVILRANIQTTPRFLYQLELARWNAVLYGLIFFGFFGLSAEARKRYASVWLHVSKIFCWKTRFLRESSGYALFTLSYSSFSRTNLLTTRKIVTLPPHANQVCQK
jgi:Pheromone A receptor